VLRAALDGAAFFRGDQGDPRPRRQITPSGPIANAVIVVEDDRIVSVGTAAPPRAPRLSISGDSPSFPGMIDVQRHMTTTGTARRARGRSASRAVRRRHHRACRRQCPATLETGVTTVRDLGAQNEVDYAMRDLIDDGQDGRAADVRRRPGLAAAAAAPPSPSVPPAGRGADRRRLGLGQDLRLARQLPERGDDADSAVRGDEGGGRRGAREESQGRDPLVRPSGVKDAVRAGADSVEHGIDLDDDTIARW
jgi:hypothetical protein